MNRINKRGGFAHILLLLLVVGIFAAGGWWLWSRGELPISKNSPTPTPTPDPIVNWETYINPGEYELKYPKNIFSYSTEMRTDIQYWTNISGTMPPLSGNSPDRLLLLVNISDPENMANILVEYYKASIKSSEKSVAETLGITKLSNLVTNGVQGATYFESIISNGERLLPYSYVAVWEKGGKYYQLSLSATSEEKLESQKQLFDQILSTFKFLEGSSAEGEFCGGISGKQCPEGYICRLEGNYPDAGGTCVKKN